MVWSQQFLFVSIEVGLTSSSNRQFAIPACIGHDVCSVAVGSLPQAEEKVQWRGGHPPHQHIMYAPSRKLTWQWKITIFNRRYIFKCLFFHCHISFPGGSISSYLGWIWIIHFWFTLDLKKHPHNYLCEHVGRNPLHETNWSEVYNSTK